MLPEYIVAAFVKKLARLSLLVPSHACIYIIALIYKLILKHPQIKVLIHRVGTNLKGRTYLHHLEEFSPAKGPLNLQSSENRIEVWKGIDPFLPDEVDPKKSKAMESCLWEIETLCHHYDPLVVKTAEKFKDNIKDQVSIFDIRDFTNISYDQVSH